MNIRRSSPTSRSTYWARTQTDGVRWRNQLSRAVRLRGNRSGVISSASRRRRLQAGHRLRPSQRYSSVAGRLRFTRRSQSSRIVRKLVTHRTLAYTGDPRRPRSRPATCAAVRASSSRTASTIAASYSDVYEFSLRRLRLVGVTIPAGGYDCATTRVRLHLGRQRPISATSAVERGRFCNGVTATSRQSGTREGLRRSCRSSRPLGRLGRYLPKASSTTAPGRLRVTYTVTPEDVRTAA